MSEIVNGDNYQIKFEYLSSLADQAYRILYESNEPMHLRDIQRQINHRLAKAGLLTDANIRNLGNQLASDSRFEAVGRSGIWSLAKWEDVYRKTIVELMQEFFHIKQSGASSAEVYDYVSSKRADVSKHSVYVYLSTHDAFVKVGKNLYELSAWGGKPYKSTDRLSSQEVQRLFIPAVKKIFADIPGNSIPMSELNRILAERTGIPSSTLYLHLRKSPMIRLEDDPTSKKKRKIAYYADGVQNKAGSVTSNKTTLREFVQQEVKQHLQKLPNHKSAVTDLSVHIEKVTKCKKTTFYRYLSEMENTGDIRKEYEEGKLYCYLESPEVYEAPIALSFPQIEEVKDDSLKGNLIRAIKNLNIDNVDMGLFQLGKIFENELKAFLSEARDKGKYTINSKDLGRLASMIDCVERNGIIKKKYHLTLLREHRNERAHGKIPNLDERQKLMQHAPFLGDLYINYILFFNEQRKIL